MNLKTTILPESTPPLSVVQPECVGGAKIAPNDDVSDKKDTVPITQKRSPNKSSKKPIFVNVFRYYMLLCLIKE